MGQSIVAHIDAVPYLHGNPSKGEPYEFGHQFLGDQEKGPWIIINSIEPGHAVPPHSHSEDEVILILGGELTLGGGKKCTAGTVIYMEKGTAYSFTVGPEGVRFLNVRSGPAQVKTAERYKGEFTRR